jgi:hypothetical protein
MTPENKAIELIGKFNFTHDKINRKFLFHQNLDESKRCALIAVDEMMIYSDFHLNYLQEVKDKIENFAEELKLKDIQL